jgi:hypothetical protein
MQDNNDQTRKGVAANAGSRQHEQGPHEQGKREQVKPESAKLEPAKPEPGKLEPGHEAERQAEARRERAAKTLRDNLMRRKQQGRARRAGAADETSGLPAAKTDESAD